MKEQDNITHLFERLTGNFDLNETPQGHQRRFLEKLNQEQAKPKKLNFWKLGSIAAAITLLIILGGSLFAPQQPQEADLASVSPEMEQTQSFFTTAIHTEIEALKKFESPENNTLIQDALLQVDKLEKDYQSLKKDLVESGNNKQVINAMITNFQNRIAVLEKVSETIETIKKLKNTTDETYL
ncbi:hypothetical protein [Rasiella sp. SM2506]|uniref:hypothetical protein n=1 Tax=Rasiella sp. SM2506 TaxID=3423914 RepID=UPI003D78DF2B